MRRVTLGRYPGMTVEMARRKAVKIRGEIANQMDPAEERRKAREELTFGELADKYIELRDHEDKKSWQRYLQIINGSLAHWERRKLSDIEPDEVECMHKSIAENGRYAAKS
jgi:hypothetical protein